MFAFSQFSKETGNQVEECKLRVSYVAPKQPPSPVREGSEEGTSPRVSVSENGTANTLDSNTVSIDYFNFFFIMLNTVPPLVDSSLIMHAGLKSIRRASREHLRG